jgi:alpha-methylacyl-CoA racemase
MELGGIGPVPFAAMLLADLGADVVKIVRSDSKLPVRLYDRGKTTVSANLTDRADADRVHELIDRADVVIEGFRPGVVERLGFGPAECLQTNSALVYGRMSGWGSAGPLRDAPGHDINFLALAGVLAAVGSAGSNPVPPLTLVGDFGGGGAVLAFGLCSALLHARHTGMGQVVEHSVLEGAALLSVVYHGLLAEGAWTNQRGSNLLDSGAPFYRAYEAADGRWLAVGALEPDFYTALVTGLGLDAGTLPDRTDRDSWPVLHAVFAARFRERSAAEWEESFAGTQACVTPVLTFDEAPGHPHHVARSAYVALDSVPQPAPAPRFSATPTQTPRAAGTASIPVNDVIARWRRR